jgi:hypothetical protein
VESNIMPLSRERRYTNYRQDFQPQSLALITFLAVE